MHALEALGKMADARRQKSGRGVCGRLVGLLVYGEHGKPAKKSVSSSHTPMGSKTTTVSLDAGGNGRVEGVLLG